jgi:DNA polymerase epsilon subunit 1
LHEQLAWEEQRDAQNEILDRIFGYIPITPGPPRLGFLLKMGPCSSKDRESGNSRAALALYFLQADGGCFKVVQAYEPYFYLLVKEKYLMEVEEFLRRTFGKEVSVVQTVDKEDLELVNHLSGLKRRYVKVSFLTIQALLSVRGKLMGKIKKNRRRLGIEETYADMHQNDGFDKTDEGGQNKDYADFIYDIREYDVTYYQRVAIDLGFRVGYWYEGDEQQFSG